jgi:hypothetical protein
VKRGLSFVGCLVLLVLPVGAQTNDLAVAAPAGEAEKKYLLGIIGKHPKEFESLEHGGRHFTCYLDTLRYDAVHDLLTPEERAKDEKIAEVNCFEFALAQMRPAVAPKAPVAAQHIKLHAALPATLTLRRRWQ